LNEGDQIVISMTTSTNAPASNPSNPFGGGFPRR
jgi:hypothetical protein